MSLVEEGGADHTIRYSFDVSLSWKTLSYEYSDVTYPQKKL